MKNLNINLKKNDVEQQVVLRNLSGDPKRPIVSLDIFKNINFLLQFENKFAPGTLPDHRIVKARAIHKENRYDHLTGAIITGNVARCNAYMINSARSIVI